MAPRNNAAGPMNSVTAMPLRNRRPTGGGAAAASDNGRRSVTTGMVVIRETPSRVRPSVAVGSFGVRLQLRLDARDVARVSEPVLQIGPLARPGGAAERGRRLVA